VLRTIGYISLSSSLLHVISVKNHIKPQHNTSSKNLHKKIKMRFSTLASALTTLSLASARIVGLSTPSALTPNSTFTITLLSENYIQSVQEVAVAWGFQVPTSANPQGYPYTLGRYTNSSYLGPEKSNTQGNVSIEAMVPGALEVGQDVVFSVALMSIYGASGGPITQSWNVTVHVGEADVANVVSSREVGWKETTG
jgi:hypothetical protein